MKHVDKNKRGKKLSKDLASKKNSITMDKADKYFFEKMKQSSPKSIETAKEGKKEYEPFPELHEDLFGSLFRYNPNLREEWELKESHLMNREIIKKIMESPQFKELRVNTKSDEISSIIGTEVLSDEARKLLAELKEQQEKLKELQDAAQALHDQQGQGQGQGQGQPGDGEDGNPASGEDLMKLKEAKERLAKARQEFKKSMEQPEVRRNISSMMNKVQDKTTEVNEMISSWGLGQDPEFTNAPYHEKMELLNSLRNNEKLKKIADIAGKLKRLAQQRQVEKVKKGIDEVYTIKQGKDFSRMLPGEILRLKSKSPAVRINAIIDYCEGKLLNFDLRGKEKKHKGAIVCCIDESGSMSGLGEVWSKAVALALLEIAMYQKRSFFVIHFSGGYGDSDKMHVNRFPKGAPYNVKEIVDMATHFIGGGTDFEKPLTKAKEVIMEDEIFSKADIVFITDGECAVGDKWLENYLAWKKEKKISIYSILIDSGYCSSSQLEEFSDRIEKLNDLKDSNSRTEIAINLFDAL